VRKVIPAGGGIDGDYRAGNTNSGHHLCIGIAACMDLALRLFKSGGGVLSGRV